MRYNGKKTNLGTCINTTPFLREGESIEEKLRRATATQEPLEVDFTPEIYQERAEGVDPMCDVRTDKFQMAQDACDTMSRTYLLGRMNRQEMGKKKAEEFTYITDTDGNIVKNEINI